MRTDRQSAIRLLQLMMVASLVLPAVLFVFASWLSYRHESEVADDRIERSLDILHEHALKVFQTGERAIAEVAEVIRGMPDGEIAASQQRLHLRLKQIVDSMPQFQAILISDRTGRPLAASILPVIAENVTVADRAYYQAHLKGGEGTLISEVLQPRWARGLTSEFFNLSRRRETVDGGFAGIISVAVRISYFEDFYQLMGAKPGSLFALIRTDGKFLARYPALADRNRSLSASSPLLIAVARGQERNLYTNPRSQLDGTERRIGNRKLAGYPVYVNAGTDTAAIRADWLATMASHLIFGLP